MIKIGVLSDTHAKNLPDEVWVALKKVDIIFHAGDFTRYDDFEAYNQVKEVTAVLGNMDEGPLREKLNEKEIVEVEDVKIGIMHGYGPPKRVIDYVVDQFKKNDVDVVVFGHSHMALNEVRDGVLYFNPGSPTDTISAPFTSYGILTINGKKAQGKIIKC